MIKEIDELQKLIEYERCSISIVLEPEGCISWAVFDPVADINYKNGRVQKHHTEQGFISELIPEITKSIKGDLELIKTIDEDPS